ncbi:MAG TPA: sensor histidine kinase [Candidatus Dormibacteraeota bacterium]|nr:sensor histidine kinase [Candidatus Dormibacteraeota bacterium]
MAETALSRARTHRAQDATVIEKEVKRLVARELHDRVAQTLTGMLVDVENFKAEEVGWTDVVEYLDKVQTSTRQVLQSLRQLLHELRGETMLETDLPKSIQALADRFTAQTGIDVEVAESPRWPHGLAPHVELNLYRIVEEALANIRMHSAAQHAVIKLDVPSPGHLSIVVRDDGRGVDTDVSRPVGLGTLGMRERALLLGGKLTIESGPGIGTTVNAVFPTEIPRADDSPSPEILIGNEVLA